MINYERFVLKNGLRVLIHEDDSTPMAAVNMLYNVGSKDEHHERTGFAHLFEHLMFGGSKNVPDFDEPVQNAGGENNAFTNNDMTSFYEVVPAKNIETILWLESDRMLQLNFDQEVLDIQRRVVVEEFKETCLNQPYGDVWHHLGKMAFKVHPYQWPTIGKVPKHVEEATMADVEQFFYKFYRPNNAVLSIAGNVKSAEILPLVEKWFGDIPPGEKYDRDLPEEPPQQQLEQYIEESNVPVDAMYFAFKMPSRLHEDYYAIDLLSDVLCNGSSSRLYRILLKEKQLFSFIDCYLTGSVEPGLFMIEAKPSEGVSFEAAKVAIWEELDRLKVKLVRSEELEKVKNKVESNLIFSETNVLNKAMNLAYYELIGDVERVNEEVDYYFKVTEHDLLRVAKNILREENCCELYYKVKGKEELVKV